MLELEEIRRGKKVTNISGIAETAAVQTPYSLVGWRSAG